MQQEFEIIEDLIADESFVLWALHRNDAGWDNWLATHPEKKQLVNDAIALVTSLQIKEAAINEEQILTAETKLFASIDAAKQAPAKVISIAKKWWYAAAAAVIIGLAWFGIATVNNNNKVPAPLLATSYGQVQQNKLPDGTEVILNANSNVSFKEGWKEGTDREVWIKGEAFFHVKKTPTRDKFTVHTDAFDIEVTGTSFNVLNRGGASTIILKDGSVIIHRKGMADMAMVPGEEVTFNNEQLQKNTVQKTDYLAWTENKLVFENTPMPDVAKIIKEHYGVTVLLKGDKVIKDSIGGIMANNNLSVLLQSLEASHNFSIVQSRDTITISNKD